MYCTGDVKLSYLYHQNLAIMQTLFRGIQAIEGLKRPEFL